MNSVGSGFYVEFVCDRGYKGTNQKIVRVASSRTLSLGQIYKCPSLRELVVKFKGL